MIRNSQSITKPPLLVAVIDADLCVRLSTARIVQALGLRAATFTRVFEFLRSNRRDDAACLVLDIQSSDLSGLALQRWFTATRRPARFVFVSAVTTDCERQSALAAGAVELLQKPFDEAVLIRAIQMALGADRTLATRVAVPPNVAA